MTKAIRHLRPDFPTPLLPIAVVLWILASPALGRSPDYVVYGGVYDTNEGAKTHELGFESRWRLPWNVEGLSWVAGVAATSDEAAWIYTGAVYEFRLGERATVGPGFAVSLWDRGDGKDLGGPLEFRSSIELAFRVSPRARIGLLFYHLSNADFYDSNPGSNSLVVTWSLGRSHSSP